MVATDILHGLRAALPVAMVPYALPRAAGLVIVDEVNGFCTVGAGALAPTAPNRQIDQMIEQTDRLAREFRRNGRPILAFLDTHEPGKPEPPYPPHCERGTGEEDLVEALAWLERDPGVTLLRKDCINAFVGAIEPVTAKGVHGASHNRCLDWINSHRLEAIIVVGICTDICVMDFVLTMLSARNHGLTPTLKDIVPLEPACATYDLPADTVAALDLPPTAAHPQALTHHIGLYAMAARGAVIAREIARS